MTTAPTLNPQVLGQAENAHRALLNRILSNTGNTYHQWVALTFVAGAPVDRSELIGRMIGAVKVDDLVADATLGELTATGLLEDVQLAEGVRVQLTGAGRALHGRIRSAVNEVVARLYADLSADDLATAGRVLTLITARANAELTA